MTPPRLLFLGAQPEPQAALNPGAALHAIQRAVAESTVAVDVGWAVGPADVQHRLNAHRPCIVHFHAHGNERGKLMLEGEDGRAVPVRPDAMAAMLASAREPVRLVFFGACHSEDLAESAARIVDFAVGMRGLVEEKTVTELAASFYRALAAGCTVQAAFDQALAVDAMLGLGEKDKPALRVRDGVDATRVVLVPTLAEAPPERVLPVLFLGASPASTARNRLDHEVREISRRLSASPNGRRFRFVNEWNVRAGDLQACLLNHRPAIVHFSGPGGSDGQILLEGKAGELVPLEGEALGELFRLLRRDVRCVVLNACFSMETAYAIARHIDVVVGMTGAIAHGTTIEFSGAFYQALAFGESMSKAFDLGLNQIKLGAWPHAHVPRIVPRQGLNPEHIWLLDDQRAEGPSAVQGAPTPAMSQRPLPAPPPFRGTFVGRENELASMRRIFSASAWADPGLKQPAVVALRGIGGIGKTALAMRFADMYAGDFPGGALWADLGTNRDDGERAADISPDEILRIALGKWKGELGVPGPLEGPTEDLLGSVRGALAARRAALGRCLHGRSVKRPERRDLTEKTSTRQS